VVNRGRYGVSIGADGGPFEIDFRFVPDGPKAARNRLHLDIKPVNRGPGAELGRLLALGARQVDVGQGERSWYVLADPEGNEFCLCRP
jgi:Glyoxalase-like domain